MPSIIPICGVVISIALLTQVEGATYGRAGLLIAVGVALWVVNEIVIRPHGST